MANMTTTSQVGPGATLYYDRVLLLRAKPLQVHNRFAQQRSLPAKNTDTVKYRRYLSLATATTALTEGITPAGNSLSVTDMTVQLEQYGSYVTLTDKVQYIVEDNEMNEAADILGQQMGETLDELTRDMLASTASVYNCSGGTNGDTPTELTYGDIQAVVRTLKRQNAKVFVPYIRGEDRVGTSPVREAYWVMAHTDILDDLESVTNFVNTAQYPAQQNIEDGEWGAVGNTRWVLTSIGYINSAASTLSADVYSCFTVAKDAYGAVELNEGMMKNIYKPLGHGNDPLDQRHTLGWKAFFGSRILNDNFMVNLLTTHS